MKRVLMVAYHFPPLAGGSGIQRTLRFVQLLPRMGWQPIVLTVNARAYEKVGADLLPEVPSDTVVRRAFALDAARHLCIGGRYAAATARPDRWSSWRFDGVREGMRLVREYRPDAIWSTFPVPTAHVIGRELQRKSGLPWIADFRDPMAQDGYPADPVTWQHYKTIEETAILHAAFSTFTTPSAARTYRERYPAAADRIGVLENGYDEDSFAEAEAMPESGDPVSSDRGTITLLHSGIVYPSERDPVPLFIALGRLLEQGGVVAGRLKIQFRAAVHDDLLRRSASEHGVESLVEILPPIAYREALREMVRADALLVMQGANCNEQIPAKIYEYLRARRPILCLADPSGDTAGLIRDAGIHAIARLESPEEICNALPPFLDAVARGTAVLPDATAVQKASRLARTQALAQLMDRVVVGSPSGQAARCRSSAVT